MRTEIKAALVLGLFGILGAVIWGINSGRKSRVELPLDVSATDLASSGQTTLASDLEKFGDDAFKSAITSPPHSAPPEDQRDSPPDTGDEAAENPIDSQLGDDSESTLPPRVEADRPLADTDETVDPDEPDSASRFTARDGDPSDAPSETPRQPQATGDQPLVPEPGGNTRLSALNTSPNTDTTYIIQPGDTFISIARGKYGHDKYWKAIQAANPDLEATRLQEDQTIKLPSTDQIAALARKSTVPANEAKPAELGAIKAQRGTYIVEPGDTLSAIAQKLLEDQSRWDEIYELNRDKLSSPDRIVDGTELRIPQRKPKKTG